MRERLTFEHLAGPRAGEVDVVEALPATLGSEPGLPVVVPEAAPRHAQIVRQGRDIVLVDAGSGQITSLAGEAVREAVLRDGDVLELGTSGFRLRFHHEGGPHVSLLHRSSGAHRAFHATLAIVLISGTGVLSWTYRLNRQVTRLQEALRAAENERRDFQERIETERRRAESDRQSLEARIEESRKREEELNHRLTAAAGGGEVQALRDELQRTRERLVTLEGERAVGERIIREFGGGVCLIHGSYAFYDDAGRPLRYRVDAAGEPAHEADGSLALEVEGSGPVHNVDYFGTGFLVDRKGLVLTNRHVAEPWWKDETAAALAKEGFRPRFVAFRAFFPRVGEAFRLEIQRRSDTVDLALLRLDLKGRRIPVLPLDPTGRGAVAGQPVVVVGYPTGLEALLAKADSGVVQEILAAGTGAGRVTEALARRGLIRPSTTQGHIGDVTKTDIVFDAPTTQGGSGGPVFGKSGQVIAVEYAVLSKFGGNSFGLPVRHALELLKEPRT